MPALAPKQIAALLWQVGLRRSAALRNLTAIALAESGGEVAMVRDEKLVRAEDGSYVPASFYGGPSMARRGLWLINDSRGFDRRAMVTDAAYAAARAVEVSGKGDRLDMWPSWNSGTYKQFLPVAMQAEAAAAAVSGSILAEDGSYVPASFYAAAPAAGQSGSGPAPGANLALYDPQGLITMPKTAPMAPPVVPPPHIGGPAQPLTASFEQAAPLSGLRITGSQLTSDLGSIVLGDPEFNAGLGEIPNLTFTIADPQGDLLWKAGNLWQVGAKVQYLDLDLRLDECKFAPGGHGTGQLEITAIDALVFALQRLRGARVVKNVSPTAFIREEIRLAGFDPGRYFLGENLPAMTQIARDVPTEQQSGGDQDPPSAWTTIQRLGKETGRRAFISGRKLIFGTLAFARDWAGPGDLRIGWHGTPPGEQWLNLPSGGAVSGGSSNGQTEVTGQVPLNRARFFRPGVCVIVYKTPSIAAGDRRMVCTSIAHSLSRDSDGAEVSLIDPVELKPEKPR